MLLIRHPAPALGVGAGLAIAVAAVAAAWTLRIATDPVVRPGAPAFGAPAPAPAPWRPAPTRPARALSLVMRQGEGLASALLRAGVEAGEVTRVCAALADDFDTVNPHPGLELRLGVTDEAGGGAGPVRLASLAVNAADDVRLDLARGVDGRFRLSRLETPAFATHSLIAGKVEGSLYLSLADRGLTPDMAATIVGLFGRRLDLGRDIQDGAPFRLVFEQRTRGGAPADEAARGPGDLVYAEVVARTGVARLYRFSPPGGGPADYVDGQAGPGRVLLLRTPVDGARVTSAYGFRPHPILGYTRLHQGVDFAAPSGAPVLAAGDGIVEEARWSGGYGRWLRIRHVQGLETGYGHLLAWAPGVFPGAPVRQGQVVAFVGASGLATGPHLHFEVFRSGARVDPAGPVAAGASRSDPGLLLAFRARKAGLDAQVAALETACAEPPTSERDPGAVCKA
jgi:murein DD-endopeptidase MepM/ murein hydrolase activator NlpD